MVAALDGTGLRSIGPSDRESYDPAWTPDGKRIVYVDHALALPGQRDARDVGTRLVVADIRSGRATRSAGVKGRVRMPSVRADGRTILYTRFSDGGRRPELWVVPRSGGRARRLMTNAAYGVWSPDGRSIAYRRLQAAVAQGVYPYDAGLWIADARGRRARRIWRGAGCCHMAHVDWSASRPAWAPDGSRLVLAKAPADHWDDVIVLGVAGGRAIAVGQGVLPTWLDDETLIVQDYEATPPP
jgi:TolB protein